MQKAQVLRASRAPESLRLCADHFPRQVEACRTRRSLASTDHNELPPLLFRLQSSRRQGSVDWERCFLVAQDPERIGPVALPFANRANALPIQVCPQLLYPEAPQVGVPDRASPLGLRARLWR